MSSCQEADTCHGAPPLGLHCRAREEHCSLAEERTRLECYPSATDLEERRRRAARLGLVFEPIASAPDVSFLEPSTRALRQTSWEYPSNPDTDGSTTGRTAAHTTGILVGGAGDAKEISDAVTHDRYKLLTWNDYGAGLMGRHPCRQGHTLFVHRCRLQNVLNSAYIGSKGLASGLKDSSPVIRAAPFHVVATDARSILANSEGLTERKAWSIMMNPSLRLYTISIPARHSNIGNPLQVQAMALVHVIEDEETEGVVAWEQALSVKSSFRGLGLASLLRRIIV